MNILITSDSYFPKLGGAEVYAYQLATFLKKEGFSVEIMTTETDGWVKDIENPTYRFAWSRNPIVIIKFIFNYYRLVKKADIVHSIYAHKLAALAGILCLFTGTKLVVSLQGRGILDLPGHTRYYAALHKTYRIISLKLAHKVVASCKEFADIASRYTSSEKIVYIPNLVDIDEFKASKRDYSILPFKYTNENLIFTIRRLVRKNGVQFAVEAMPKILSKSPNSLLIIIGAGILEDHLKKRAHELGVSDRIHFLGRIENYKLKEFLNLADVVLFPSTAESTSIACLESMSLGKPIVASRVGGYPEMVNDGENGYLVNLTDNYNSNYDAPMTVSEDKLESMASSVSNILSDNSTKEKFGTSSRRLAEDKFSWQKNIHSIISNYSNL